MTIFALINCCIDKYMATAAKWGINSVSSFALSTVMQTQKCRYNRTLPGNSAVFGIFKKKIGSVSIEMKAQM